MPVLEMYVILCMFKAKHTVSRVLLKLFNQAVVYATLLSSF